MAESVGADEEESRNKGERRARAEPMTHHPRWTGNSTREVRLLRGAFGEDNELTVEAKEPAGASFRPRSFPVSSHMKPQVQSSQEKAKEVRQNPANIQGAAALAGPPSTQKSFPVAHEESESGFDSNAESDHPLNIHPDKIEIKKNEKLVINIPKESVKEMPASGCCKVKFTRCEDSLTMQVRAREGNHSKMAEVITPRWPEPGKVIVTLYTKTANEKCIIGKGEVTFYVVEKEPVRPSLVIVSQLDCLPLEKIKEVIREAVSSGRRPSLDTQGCSNPESKKQAAIFVCRQEDGAMIQAYSSYVYDQFPECGLPRADLTLPELRARLSHLVYVLPTNDLKAEDSGKGEGESILTETTENDPIYSAVAGEDDDGSNDRNESLYDYPMDEGVNGIPSVFLSLVASETKDSVVDEKNKNFNGLVIEPGLEMSSETGLKLLLKVQSGELTLDRAIEDAIDYSRFKKASRQKPKNWKENSASARRRKEQTVNVLSLSSTDSHSIHRRSASSQACYNREEDNSGNADVSSLGGTDAEEGISKKQIKIRKHKSLPKSFEKMSLGDSNLKRLHRFNASSDSGINDCKNSSTGRPVSTESADSVSYPVKTSVRDPRSLLPPTPKSEAENKLFFRSKVSNV